VSFAVCPTPQNRGIVHCSVFRATQGRRTYFTFVFCENVGRERSRVIKYIINVCTCTPCPHIGIYVQSDLCTQQREMYNEWWSCFWSVHKFIMVSRLVGVGGKEYEMEWNFFMAQLVLLVLLLVWYLHSTQDSHTLSLFYSIINMMIM